MTTELLTQPVTQTTAQAAEAAAFEPKKLKLPPSSSSIEEIQGWIKQHRLFAAVGSAASLTDKELKQLWTGDEPVSQIKKGYYLRIGRETTFPADITHVIQGLNKAKNRNHLIQLPEEVLTEVAQAEVKPEPKAETPTEEAPAQVKEKEEEKAPPVAEKPSTEEAEAPKKGKAKEKAKAQAEPKPPTEGKAKHIATPKNPLPPEALVGLTEAEIRAVQSAALKAMLDKEVADQRAKTQKEHEARYAAILKKHPQVAEIANELEAAFAVIAKSEDALHKLLNIEQFHTFCLYKGMELQ